MDDDDDGNIERVVAVVVVLVAVGLLPFCCLVEDENKEMIEEDLDFFLFPDALELAFLCFSFDAAYIDEISEMVEKMREVMM